MASDKNNFIKMITTIIFDFGDVFINLDKEGAYKNFLELFGLVSKINEKLEKLEFPKENLRKALKMLEKLEFPKENHTF